MAGMQNERGQRCAIANAFAQVCQRFPAEQFARLRIFEIFDLVQAELTADQAAGKGCSDAVAEIASAPPVCVAEVDGSSGA